MDIKLWSYCGDSSSSQSNAKCVKIGDVELYFSYETIVGLRYRGRTLVTQNTWGPTTGKHLNAIDGGNKADRVTMTELLGEIECAIGEVVSSEYRSAVMYNIGGSDEHCTKESR